MNEGALLPRVGAWFGISQTFQGRIQAEPSPFRFQWKTFYSPLAEEKQKGFSRPGEYEGGGFETAGRPLETKKPSSLHRIQFSRLWALDRGCLPTFYAPSHPHLFGGKAKKSPYKGVAGVIADFHDKEVFV